jgi:predicted nuclease of predicted toxin-antitoxin system
MRFLFDNDVYAVTAQFLRGLGHDVVTVAGIGLAQAVDTDLLEEARQQQRIFVTRDRDFGALVFVHGMGPGVLYLRMLPSTQGAVHRELERVLQRYTEDELAKAFVVIEPGSHRYRQILPP